MADVFLVGHLTAALFLAGLSWTVAVVVYPGFAEAGPGDSWPAIHAGHSRRMSLLVGVPWAVEGVACAGLLIVRPAHVPLALVVLAAAAGAATVLLTVRSVVPVHQRLGYGFDTSLLRRLNRWHAWRTLAWTVAAVAGVAMMVNQKG